MMGGGQDKIGAASASTDAPSSSSATGPAFFQHVTKRGTNGLESAVDDTQFPVNAPLRLLTGKAARAVNDPSNEIWSYTAHTISGKAGVNYYWYWGAYSFSTALRVCDSPFLSSDSLSDCVSLSAMHDLL